VVSYRETVTAKSSQQCLAKSGNKHNRIVLAAEPLADGMAEDIERRVINPAGDVKVIGLFFFNCLLFVSCFLC
jgi:elongation factor 2